MLETGFHTYTRFSDDPAKVNGTIGRVVSSMELKILDEGGPRGAARRGRRDRRARPQRASRLSRQRRPPTPRRSPRTAGSAPATSAVSSTLPGNVEIVGRRKEIINRGGKKFFPREVEEILYTHPKVMHAAMVGVADARLGERNCLCVIPKAGQTVTLAEMIAHLQGPGRRLQAARGAASSSRSCPSPRPASCAGTCSGRADRQGAGRAGAPRWRPGALHLLPAAGAACARARPRLVAVRLARR